MIPNKLYIPTTTLNFNNIMACESISPAGFYPVRDFGYKRFDKVGPNNLNRRIILYDRYPIFNINDEEFDNYPLVVEIEPKYVDEDIIHEYKNGVFFTEETIYFNPFSTKIYFRNEGERRSTLSKVEQSLSTKMASIYQSHIFVKTPSVETFEWNNNEITDSSIDFAKHISRDRKINKLKGFLYTYLLGANRSLSSEIVTLKKYAKELKNVLSSIITNPDGRASYKQEEEIKMLYQEINNAFYKIEGFGEKLKNIVRQKTEEYNCTNFTEILKAEDLYDIWYQKQNLKPSYQIQSFYLRNFQKSSSVKKNSEYDNKEAEENQKYFDRYFTELGNAIDRFTKSTPYSIIDLPILQHCSRVDIVPADKKGFQSKLFNEYCAENWNKEEFIASRLDFATVGGTLFKEELHDNWENSPYKPYINDLRKNIASHTPFGLNSIQNLTLQSFAAFCQKGEDDIEKLEDYLISNEIGDFRIAFALWGIVFGFANMPKTLANDLFLFGDLDYVSEVYKYIYKQVHGIDLEGKIERKQEKKIGSFSSKINEQTEAKEKQKISVNQEDPEEKQHREKLKQAKIKEKQIDSVVGAWKENHFLINEKLFSTISKIQGIGKATVEKIKNALLPNQEKTIQIQEATLFSFQPEKYFYKDVNIYSLIDSLLPNDVKIKKQFREDLDWFQDEYNKGDLSQYYSKASRDNSSVIEAYNRYLTKKEYVNKINISLIILKLKESYS